MSSIIVAFITSCGVIINTIISNKTQKKVETIGDLKKEFKTETENIKNQFKMEINSIKEEFKTNLNDARRENDKTFLTDFITEMKNGEKKSEIQIMRAREVKKEYNNLNGDSYIDCEWKKLEKEGIL